MIGARGHPSRARQSARHLRDDVGICSEVTFTVTGAGKRAAPTVRLRAGGKRPNHLRRRGLLRRQGSGHRLCRGGSRVPGGRAAGEYDHAGLPILIAVEQVRDVPHSTCRMQPEETNLPIVEGWLVAVNAIDGRGRDTSPAPPSGLPGPPAMKPRQIGLTLDHLGRRMPIPATSGLARDFLHAGPGENRHGRRGRRSGSQRPANPARNRDRCSAYRRSAFPPVSLVGKVTSCRRRFGASSTGASSGCSSGGSADSTIGLPSAPTGGLAAPIRLTPLGAPNGLGRDAERGRSLVRI